MKQNEIQLTQSYNITFIALYKKYLKSQSKEMNWESLESQNSLACQVNLGRDTKFSKKSNKNISVSPGSLDITSDCDHFIHWKRVKNVD